MAHHRDDGARVRAGRQSRRRSSRRRRTAVPT
ncbi:hypothetical protein Ae263Ps1_2027 [Pseudonocardia sp. Ae263_Ps1]|nr:hypothetical protein Ae263Ps1_2027 [Pseudonocardia sp. Ae263_Ps1]